MAPSYRLHPTTLPPHPPSSHSEPLRPTTPLKAPYQLNQPRPSNDSYLHPPPPPPTSTHTSSTLQPHISTPACNCHLTISANPPLALPSLCLVLSLPTDEVFLIIDSTRFDPTLLRPLPGNNVRGFSSRRSVGSFLGLKCCRRRGFWLRGYGGWGRGLCF